MSQQAFAAKLEISPASLSSIFTGRTRPTNNHVQAIHKAFPGINISWLLFGEGEMYSHPTAKEGEEKEESGDVNPDERNENSEREDETLRHTEAPVFSSDQTNKYSDQTSKYSDQANRSRHKKTGNWPADMPSSLSPFDFREEIIKEQNRNIKKRQIKEIRVFFDDGTYESFVPSR